MPTQRPVEQPAPGNHGTGRRIVVGVDGSPGARTPLAWALSVDVAVAAGSAGEVLVQHAARAELLVGSRSRGTLPGMVLGSVAPHCVVHAPCPVEVVRPVPGAARTRPAAAAAAATLG
jgi:nucleotide-binding universal stress UspA family protein